MVLAEFPGTPLPFALSDPGSVHLHFCGRKFLARETLSVTESITLGVAEVKAEQFLLRGPLCEYLKFILKNRGYSEILF